MIKASLEHGAGLTYSFCKSIVKLRLFLLLLLNDDLLDLESSVMFSSKTNQRKIMGSLGVYVGQVLYTYTIQSVQCWEGEQYVQ